MWLLAPVSRARMSTTLWCCTTTTAPAGRSRSSCPSPSTCFEGLTSASSFAIAPVSELWHCRASTSPRAFSCNECHLLCRFCSFPVWRDCRGNSFLLTCSITKATLISSYCSPTVWISLEFDFSFFPPQDSSICTSRFHSLAHCQEIFPSSFTFMSTYYDARVPNFWLSNEIKMYSPFIPSHFG